MLSFNILVQNNLQKDWRNIVFLRLSKTEKLRILIIDNFLPAI